MSARYSVSNVLPVSANMKNETFGLLISVAFSLAIEGKIQTCWFGQ